MPKVVVSFRRGMGHEALSSAGLPDKLEAAVRSVSGVEIVEVLPPGRVLTARATKRDLDRLRAALDQICHVLEDKPGRVFATIGSK